MNACQGAGVTLAFDATVLTWLANYESQYAR